MTRKRLFSAAVCVALAAGGLFVAQPSAGAAPSNDSFDFPKIVPATSPGSPGTTVGATTEVGEPDHGSLAGASLAGRTVWFRWTAPSNSDVTFSVCGSESAAALVVYTGDTIDDLEFKASSVDECPGVTMTPVSGTVYRIVVDNYGESEGTQVVLAIGQDGDSDGLLDGTELIAIGTDPADADSDDDTVPDGEEVQTALDPLSPDTDHDGLNDNIEITLGTDPRTADTDEDGLADGPEANTYGTDPLSDDSDGDLQRDGDEVECGSDPDDVGSISPDLDADSLPNCVDDDRDGDGASNDREEHFATDPDLASSVPLAVDFVQTSAPDTFNVSCIRGRCRLTGLELHNAGTKTFRPARRAKLRPVIAVFETQEDVINGTPTRIARLSKRIRPGETVTFNAPVSGPDVTQVAVTVDFDDKVDEIDEDNNDAFYGLL